MKLYSRSCPLPNPVNQVEIFEDLIGGFSNWEKHIEKLRKDAEKSKYLAISYKRKFDLELAIYDLFIQKQEYGQLLPAKRLVDYRAFTFVSTVAEISEIVSSARRYELARRIEGHMAARDTFHAIYHEIQILNDLIGEGYTVYLNDMDKRDRSGFKNFDFLTNKGGNSFEIECKSVSADSGEPVSIKKLEYLAKLLDEDNIGELCEQIFGKSFVLIEFSLEGKLDSGSLAKKAKEDIIHAVKRNTKIEKFEYTIDLSTYPISDFYSQRSRSCSSDSLHSYVSERASFIHKAFISNEDEKKTSAFFLAIGSKYKSRKHNNVAKELKRSYKKQLTHKRHSVFLVNLCGIGPERMRAYNKLRCAAEEVFARFRSDKLHQIIFLSDYPEMIGANTLSEPRQSLRYTNPYCALEIGAFGIAGK